MRAYFFTNMYLSPIQCGIQAGHVIGEMAVKYGQNPDSDFLEWANDHKTMIVLNGGMSCNLESIINHLSQKENPYEWDMFIESQEALYGALTCVGIVLPEWVYAKASEVRNASYNNDLVDVTGVSDWEWELIKILNSAKLA